MKAASSATCQHDVLETTLGEILLLPPARANPLRAILRLDRQVPLLRTVALTALLPVVVLYLVVAFQRAVPFALLLRDANASAYDPALGVMFYRGALSNLGILLWWAAASVYAFSTYLARGTARSLPIRAFLLYMALFTGLLALDDLFMLHEEVLPIRLGIAEVVLYVIYGALAAGLVAFVNLLLETAFLLLGLAFAFFAVSVFTDQGLALFAINLPPGANLLLEDLTKMLGIVCWLVFAVQTSGQLLERLGAND